MLWYFAVGMRPVGRVLCSRPGITPISCRLCGNTATTSKRTDPEKSANRYHGNAAPSWTGRGIFSRSSPGGMRQSTAYQCSVSQHLASSLEQQKNTTDVDFKPARSLYSFESFEDQLFNTLSNADDKVPISRLLNGLKGVGLRPGDPRLTESMSRISHVQTLKFDMSLGHQMALDRESFKDCIKDNILLIKRAFSGEFVIPEFRKFCNMIDQMYWTCRSNQQGEVATYIPQLSRFSADNWGVAACTIDGQRHSIGEVGQPFSMQSCSKPLNYALALNELESDIVHQYIGHEPSGESFNHIKLNNENKPHNPLINAGAIVTASLIKGNLRLADRFDYIYSYYKRMTGGEHVGFNNAIFLSERESADRNFALAYYMKENKCFPEGLNLHETLDLYFQLCSVEITCESGAVMAATLANGGICPVTGEQILSPAAVRDTLCLMHSCGMYDYSGQFAFKVGLPAKSGVSGAVLLVIPNIMGMCLWSPPLDKTGNSVRGIQFCEALVSNFNFHHFDNLKFTQRKVDPRKRRLDKQGDEVVSLLFSAYNGDVSSLRRMALSGVDMAQADYDGRTALHLAAAEGNEDCLKFLLNGCKVPHDPKDRWEQTPLDDAVRFERPDVIQILQTLHQEDAAMLEDKATVEE